MSRLAPRRRHRLLWLALLLLVLAPASLLPHLGAGTDLTRMRNALIFEPLPRAAFEWPGDTLPTGWLRESQPANLFYRETVARLALDRQPDDWERALTIARHLLGSAPVRDSGMVQAGLDDTYRRIVAQGDGYCADFIRVFRALAEVAGLTQRVWAFSFDGFGGDGHVWVEIWNRRERRWQLLDVYNNSWFDLGRGPISALELRDALRAADPALKRTRLHPQVRDGYAIEAKAWDYYRRGLDQWYLMWGVNPFAEDALTASLPGHPLARSFGQGLLIVRGLHPQVAALAEVGNRQAIAGMRWLRLHLLAVALGLLVGGVLLVLALAQALRARRT